MLKRLRNAHPVLFCILVEVLFLGSLFVSDLVFTFVLLFARADFSALDGYLYSGLQELVGTLVVVLVLQKTGRLGLLRRWAAPNSTPDTRQAFQMPPRLVP